jgi:hypothetical protein
MRRPAAGTEPHADDHFIHQWVGWGLADIDKYLEKQAAFDAWCAANPKPTADYNAGQGA